MDNNAVLPFAPKIFINKSIYVSGMEARNHFLSSLVLAAIAYPVFGWSALLIVAGGVLIDIDHYIWYIYRYRKFEFLECYRHFMVTTKRRDFKEHYGMLLAFHTIEFFMLMIFLSFYSKLALIFTIGVVSHYVMDLAFLYNVPKCFVANHSIVHWVYKNKIQKV